MTLRRKKNFLRTARWTGASSYIFRRTAATGKFRTLRPGTCGRKENVTWLKFRKRQAKGIVPTENAFRGPLPPCRISGIETFQPPALFRMTENNDNSGLLRGSAAAFERFIFEKGKTRGGGTTPPAPSFAEKPRFSAKRQAVWFERQRISN